MISRKASENSHNISINTRKTKTFRSSFAYAVFNYVKFVSSDNEDEIQCSHKHKAVDHHHLVIMLDTALCVCLYVYAQAFSLASGSLLLTLMRVLIYVCLWASQNQPLMGALRSKICKKRKTVTRTITVFVT